MLEDRNFDPLVEKFEQRIYGTLKGRLRLLRLHEDLAFLREGPPLKVWDAGCGLGQMACWFAEKGHQVTACDISARMLERARQRAQATGVNITFHHQPAQQLAPQLLDQDVILFHAVIEWLAQPLETLETLLTALKPGGHLSLLFFNHHALVYRNLMQGGWRFDYVLHEKWWGKGNKLTPPHPQKPETLLAWFRERGFTVERHTGIRVFHDYMTEEARASSEEADILAAEAKYCRCPTFRNMGRYIHLLVRKPES